MIVNNIDSFRFLALIVVIKPLLNLITKDQIECGIKFRQILNRVDVLGNRSTASKPVEALI
jgi:hypothetical protein